ncbi:interferon-inducible double-stranded RNA-dependent protein kinase activator A homolog isoform X2 [Astyanax mexicanus]|uniref:DRBM domain-containing protein n=2 Tax=Astyanax mexicanus TaxID=7994 RepID=A0A8B9J8S2_ASTMX|nr:interferon-inducible double-stranded RNA-dependent protein kinase activator A homolog isoform X2 [Astyanax mexicanus]
MASTSPSVMTESQPASAAQPVAADKTPIQVLHEYGSKTGRLPVYVMEKTDGEAHQPFFVFSVTVGDITCTGQGPSKKAAKHEAAEAALKRLDLDTENKPIAPNPENNGYSAETNDQHNPIGILQELSMQRAWRLPEYVVCLEVGPAHKKEFTVTCRLETLSETGSGSSKKNAKKAAAEKMLEKLQSLSGSSEITWCPKPNVYLESLRTSKLEKVASLRRNPLSIPNTDYVQMMLELSQEQGFEVTYFDIDELTVNGQYQCLAELSTTPVTVCHGTGISCSNAHNDAAHSALQYIKIMATSM